MNSMRVLIGSFFIVLYISVSFDAIGQNCDSIGWKRHTSLELFSYGFMIPINANTTDFDNPYHLGIFSLDVGVLRRPNSPFVELSIESAADMNIITPNDATDLSLRLGMFAYRSKFIDVKIAGGVGAIDNGFGYSQNIKVLYKFWKGLGISLTNYLNMNRLDNVMAFRLGIYFHNQL